MKIDKSINNIVSIVLFFIYFAVTIFIFANWNYISNSSEISNFPKSSVFEYRQHLAKFKDWGFFYPWKIICYLGLFQIIILTIIRIYKKIYLSKLGLASIITILLLMFFSSSISEIILNNNFYFESDFLFPATLCFSVYLLIISVFLLFMKNYIEHKKLLILNIITSISCLIFLYGYMQLFFD